MHFSLPIFLVALCITVMPAFASDYRYPYEDPYKATVYGTPPELIHRIARPVHPKERALEIKGRRVPDIFSYSREMFYSTALQKKPAPLIFIIAGTGAEHDSMKMVFLTQVFHAAGYHVVALSSPTHMNFIISMSEHAVPGYVPFDVADLYRAMTWIKGELKSRCKVTGYSVTGYSLGAMHAAFVSRMDKVRGVFDFQKTLLINPPVSLYDSVTRLDSWLTPDHLDGMTAHDEIESLINQFSNYYESSDITDLDDNFLYELVTNVKLEAKDLRALIAVDFRVSSSSMIFASDVCKRAGYIVPPDNYPLGNSAPLLPYAQEAFEISFREYVEEYLIPYLQFVMPGADREALLRRCSLRDIEDFLANDENVVLVGNADDVILNERDVAFIRSTFGDRAFLFPSGGHCGNMMYTPFVEEMLRRAAND